MHTQERRRPYAYSLSLSILILSLAGCAHFKYDPYGTGTGELPGPRKPAEPKEVIAAVVTVKGPTVIGFFPPVNEAELDRDMALGDLFEEFTAALEGARGCLAPRGVAVRAAFAQALVADTDGLQTPLPLGDQPKHVGFYLLRPDRAPQRVDAPAGTGSLRQVLNQELSAYFETPTCPALEVKS